MKRGFTLIELLVVIAIIGILSSVVLASLNTARLKSRDVRRLADIKQLQLALALYFDSNAAYPNALSSLAPTYIAVIPKDPVGQVSYAYSNASPAACAADKGTTYHLGAVMEDISNQALLTDADAAPQANTCTGGTADFSGLSAASGTCDATAGTAQVSGTPGTEKCYDQKP